MTLYKAVAGSSKQRLEREGEGIELMLIRHLPPRIPYHTREISPLPSYWVKERRGGFTGEDREELFVDGARIRTLLFCGRIRAWRVGRSLTPQICIGNREWN